MDCSAKARCPLSGPSREKTPEILRSGSRAHLKGQTGKKMQEPAPG